MPCGLRYERSCKVSNWHALTRPQSQLTGVLAGFGGWGIRTLSRADCRLRVWGTVRAIVLWEGLVPTWECFRIGVRHETPKPGERNSLEQEGRDCAPSMGSGPGPPNPFLFSILSFLKFIIIWRERLVESRPQPGAVQSAACSCPHWSAHSPREEPRFSLFTNQGQVRSSLGATPPVLLRLCC